MTIICYKDGIMAADSAVFCNEVMVAETRKIAERDGALAGATGDSDLCLAFRDWFAAGRPGVFTDHVKFEKDDQFQGLLVEANGKIFSYLVAGRIQEIRSPVMALGYAYELALGAMLAGASAEQAVKLCIDRANYVGGVVQVERSAKAEIVEQPAHVDAVDCVEMPDLKTEYFQSVPGLDRNWRENMGLVNGED